MIQMQVGDHCLIRDFDCCSSMGSGIPIWTCEICGQSRRKSKEFENLACSLAEGAD